jgi:hypothetical protein
MMYQSEFFNPNPNSEGPQPINPAAYGNMPPPLPQSFGGTATAPSPVAAPPATSVPATPVPATPTPPATTPTTAYNAFTDFADSAGMKFAMDQAMKALNEQYAAHGQLQSGAAAKGISDYAQNMALQNYFFPYMNYLSGQQAMGAGAASSIAGVGQNFGNTAAGMGQNYGNAVTGINGQMGGAINSGAQNIGNLQLANGQNQANMWGTIGSSLGSLGSSIFTGGGAPPAISQPVSDIYAGGGFGGF